MPHMIANRPRMHNLAKERTDLRAQFQWETINAVLYKIGGVVFIIGSVFFFSAFAAYANTGAWIFFGGSFLYLIVTFHDLLEVRRYWRRNRRHDRRHMLDYVAAAGYAAGTILFTVLKLGMWG